MGRALGLVAFAVIAVVGVVLVAGELAGNGGHRLTATVDEATNLIAGQELKAGGGKIGEIESLEAIDGGSKAKLTLLVDEEAWPLPEGTKFAVRWGGTASFYNRHILVSPAKDGGEPLAENAAIPAKDFFVPVEVDELLAVFDDTVRADLKSMVDRGGIAFDRSRQELRGVLDETPPAIRQGAAVFADLVDKPDALDVVVRQTDSVVDSIHRADPDISRLLGGAAVTFDAIAEKQSELAATLDGMPAMLAQTQSTLGRAETTLDNAGSLARRIGPGVRELRSTARPLKNVLVSLDDIAPDARDTLATVRGSTPEINELLARGTELSPQLESIGDGAIENLECIRPYSPELVGLLTTWADFMSFNDENDKFIRATVQHFIPSQYNSNVLSPAEAAKIYPGMTYGFPRPPGQNAGQPWFQPKCGAGPDALDPSKDQEARRANGDRVPVKPDDARDLNRAAQ